MKYIKEAIIIVLISSAIGLYYNYQSEKGIDLVRKPPEKVSDDELDKGTNHSENIENDENLEKTVSIDQVKERLDNPNFIIIDARQEEEYLDAHIGDAINIYPYDEDDIVFEKILDLPENKTFIIYCTGGNCDLSHNLAEKMLAMGYENVFIYTGGWEEWEMK